ncbi:hypothetical protein GF406_05620 [candidate division KSB1 bacterium]|nr:hypothetical protein [candidate division KSB1 bacterium]
MKMLFILLPIIIISSKISIAQVKEYTEAPPPVAFEKENAVISLGKIAADPTLYSIGSPSNEEQLMLEFINRARANPKAEGTFLKNTTIANITAAYTYFNVDLEKMEKEFDLMEPAPPLSFDAKLISSARAHSNDMCNNAFQSHTSSNGDDLVKRIEDQGYSWQGAAENIYAYAKDIFFAHAAFEVDWGSGTSDGMQQGRGHRTNTHNSAYRDVGIGYIACNNSGVGPFVVTIDFGSKRTGFLPYITGVVYDEKNGNNFYDIGEGQGNIKVDVVGSSYYAVTSSSGGYSVPVPGKGTYTVKFSGSANGSSFTCEYAITLESSENYKLDYQINKGVAIANEKYSIVRDAY